MFSRSSIAWSLWTHEDPNELISINPLTLPCERPSYPARTTHYVIRSATTLSFETLQQQRVASGILNLEHVALYIYFSPKNHPLVLLNFSLFAKYGGYGMMRENIIRLKDVGSGKQISMDLPYSCHLRLNYKISTGL